MADARKLLFATVVLLTGSPALADAPVGAAVVGFGKTEALIGAPSALAAVLAEQGAPRIFTPKPSGYLRRDPGYRLRRAVIRIGETTHVASEIVSPAVYSGKPDIFGTVALKVGRSMLDDKWRSVENATVGGNAAAFAASLRNRDEIDRLNTVNHYVNSRVRFVDDERQYGRADVWSTANRTLSRGQGDCEDYAIAKIQMLRAAGFSDRDLYLVVLKDLVRRADHAVAVVRSGEHMFVLDNGTDRLVETESASDYRPILTFSALGTWTHGYRVLKTVTVASAESPLVGTRGADSQRSLSASLLAFNTGFSR